MRDSYDAIIIGAGPGGLCAATYLGRFRRRVLVLDGGPSRAGWIPESHNTPGFPQGVNGQSLLARLREQALLAGAEIVPVAASDLAAIGDSFTVSIDGRPAQDGHSARHVVMATGVVDRLPSLAGADEAIRRGLVRVCPICDAFEAIGQQIAVLGDGDLGVREARFLRGYSDQVTLLQLGGKLTGSARDMVRDAEIGLVETNLANIAINDRIALTSEFGGRQYFDCLYLALGCDIQSGLARRCGAAHDGQNNLIVDAHQETSVRGLFAVGDVVRGLNQISVAFGEAAVAATHVHKRLREQNGEA